MGLMSRPMSNPPTRAANRAYMPGEGVLGIYGAYLGVSVVVMIGVHPLVGVGDPPSGFSELIGSPMTSCWLLFPRRSWIGIGCRGTGAKTRGGSCWSGMASTSLVGV